MPTLRTRNCDILDICRSVQYLPLNKYQFLRVHNFIQMIESTFVPINHCIFLFNEQLVWWVMNYWHSQIWIFLTNFRIFFSIALFQEWNKSKWFILNIWIFDRIIVSQVLSRRCTWWFVDTKLFKWFGYTIWCLSGWTNDSKW